MEISGGSRISQRGVRQPRRGWGWCQPIIWPISLENCMKMKTFSANGNNRTVVLKKKVSAWIVITISLRQSQWWYFLCPVYCTNYWTVDRYPESIIISVIKKSISAVSENYKLWFWKGVVSWYSTVSSTFAEIGQKFEQQVAILSHKSPWLFRIQIHKCYQILQKWETDRTCPSRDCRFWLANMRKTVATPNKVKSTQQEITYLDVHMSGTVNSNTINLRKNSWI